VENTFAYFDAIPLGSASIGQVHKARLLNGTEVCKMMMIYEMRGNYNILLTDNLTSN